ncbi:MAG: aminotransferase DegT [Rhodospirillaceae bacterium]|nr:MAG: aminotransferase DegT [Rhodospirillaceae bacterium]
MTALSAQSNSEPIPFIDLKAQRDRLRDKLDAAIAKVLHHGKFVLGPEVAEFETKAAEFAGARHAIACANGTDALSLALMASGIGQKDAVFVPTFTFAATAEAPALLGATPVFVDIAEDNFNLDVAQLAEAIETAKKNGLRPAAIIAVDLFGQPADYEAIHAVAAEHGMVVIADAAQSFGATLHGKRVGTLAPITTTSFFPAKPLGCYGDGGMLFTDDDATADILRAIHVHGIGTAQYDYTRIGMNSRLDTLQAAILLPKLAIFQDEIETRNQVAQRYSEALSETVITPMVQGDRTSAWAQYTIRLKGLNREAMSSELRAQGIPTAIYYPKPLHLQAAYDAFPRVKNLPVAERLAKEVLSLPMHPYLETKTQDRITAAVKKAAHA